VGKGDFGRPFFVPTRWDNPYPETSNRSRLQARAPHDRVRPCIATTHRNHSLGGENSMSMMTDEDLARLAPAESSLFASPIPVQSVSSDEFMPAPQTERQREFEARVKAIGTELAEHQGMSRRAFFKTSAGMAAAFVAMNETFGPLYMVSRAEAATPEMANARSAALKGQFIMDMHTHFLRDDTRLEGFVRSREAVGKSGWNPALAGKPQTIEDLKFAERHEAHVLARDLHAGHAGLARKGRPRPRSAEAGFVQGLYGWRQHQQAPRTPPLASRR